MVRRYSWRDRYWVYVVEWSVLGKWIRVGCVNEKMRYIVWEVNRVEKKKERVGRSKSIEGEKKSVEWSKTCELEKEALRYGIR